MMGPFPCPTLAFLSPYFVRVFGACCLIGGHFCSRQAPLTPTLPHGLSPPVRRAWSRALRHYGKYLIQSPPQEVAAPVVAGMCPIPTAASRDVLPDTLLALRRLNPAEKKRGLGRQVGMTPGCPVKDHMQGGGRTAEHARL